MPHALLLSPDDQAVSAISAVLEEMSVSCERPLDGASAAQKLNSRSFDLVLVDCENLPAAKLIFDVCRRGKSDANPIPIAIVDGRAGLPTAFRLGAELILTKPVAKDQARSTIRTAVSRLKKDEPAPAAPDLKELPVVTGISSPPVEKALAAAASSQSGQTRSAKPDESGTIGSEIAIADEPKAEVPAAPLPEPVSPVKAFETTGEIRNSAPPAKPSDDPVLADLERGDIGGSITQAASHENTRQKKSSAMVAVVIIALAAGGAYAAWMYQPAFRSLVQPLVSRALASVGLGRQQAVGSASQFGPQIAKPISGKPAETTAPPAGSQRATGANIASDAPPVASPATTPPGSSVPAATASESLADLKRTGTVADSSSTRPSDGAMVILSSKGAEKRLLRHVPPVFPNGAVAAGSEGTVVLKTVVDDSGKVESVQLVEGNTALAEPAIRAVEQWRYRPYVRDGKSLPFQTIVLVDFQRP